MKAWLLKRFGITPELIAHSDQIVAAATSMAATLPPAINRQVLLLLPKDRYFSWTEQWESHFKVKPRPANRVLDRWAYTRAYLVDIEDPVKDLPALVATHRKYFIESYVNGHAPKALWPWIPSEEEFPEWFEVQLVGWGTWDLGKRALSSEPDIITALGADFGAGL